uniref:Uncharacterized protein n=1 Tax=Arundo donax TaxID=35708 RepID=A0A0A9DBA3_ARUDO
MVLVYLELPPLLQLLCLLTLHPFSMYLKLTVNIPCQSSEVPNQENCFASPCH